MLTGTVLSNKMDKTVMVSVERKFMHPMFKKVVKRSKKFACHDEKNECSVGDFISMQEVRPLSKSKRWNLVKILKSAESL
ncbi:MAG: 30S ribosomal protein S17 [Nitrospinaceae bacterium]|nr:30S ribosomal protein S17 [Nitrospinaceae bacterium]NIR55549.1 30S ribosomal protein S17 [Nitrospinaceae bacterium]NIS85983.1 30S ribosomal protein S17 [Nitrospinaceae bacterium]NIT82829.1 30S ribosomal protein S17 [Nitrospinaceae bacterium]NIU45031.1 30S ribosomal protein S17 [Nitrospinaceae bacterium]